MPKISTSSVRITTPAGDVHYSITVNYTSAHGFYIAIPDEFAAAYDLMTDEQIKKHGLVCIRRGKYNNGEMICRAVAAPTEKEATSFFKTAVTYFAENTIQKRPVIILTFHKEGTLGKTSNGGHSLQDIGIKMGIDYAVEHRIGEKLQFTQEYKNHGYDCVSHVSIDNRWNCEVAVIDDTPENREYIERIYGALGQLQEQLMKLAKKDVLLAAIDNNQKLLVNA